MSERTVFLKEENSLQAIFLVLLHCLSAASFQGTEHFTCYFQLWKVITYIWIGVAVPFTNSICSNWRRKSFLEHWTATPPCSICKHSEQAGQCGENLFSVLPLNQACLSHVSISANCSSLNKCVLYQKESQVKFLGSALYSLTLRKGSYMWKPHSWSESEWAVIHRNVPFLKQGAVSEKTRT